MAPFMCMQTNTGHDRNNVFAISSLVTRMGGLWDPLAGRDQQFEKPCCNWPSLCTVLLTFVSCSMPGKFNLSAFLMPKCEDYSV